MTIFTNSLCIAITSTDFRVNKPLIIFILFSLHLIFSFNLNATPITDTTKSTPSGREIDFLSNNLDVVELLRDSSDKNNERTDSLAKRLIQGDFRYVLEKIETLSEEENNDNKILTTKITALIGLNEFENAMIDFDQLKLKDDVSAQQISLISGTLIEKNNYVDALRVSQFGLMKESNSSKLLYQMGYAFYKLGKTEMALTYLEQAAAANKLSHELKNQSFIYKAIAASYYKIGYFEKALEVSSIDGVQNLDSGFELIVKAKAQSSQGFYAEAITLLDEAQATSRYLEANLIKAQMLVLDSQQNAAIDLLNDLDMVYGQRTISDTFKLTKALVYLTDNKPELSLTILDEIEHPGRYQNFHMLKAITYYSLNDTKNTLQELKQTALPYSELAMLPDFEKRLDQPSIGPDLGLAFFCLDQKYYDQAIEIAMNRMETSSQNILLKFILAESYLQTQKFPLAINELISINEDLNGSFAIRFYLSQAYAKAGMIDEATKTYKSLTDDRPDFIKGNLVYGKLLSDFSRWQEARKVYEYGLNFEPTSPQLQLALGWILAELNDQESLTELLQLMDNNDKVKRGPLLHLKGWVAFKNDEFTRAEELLTEAIESSPGDPEICFHLGMTMVKTGKQEKAENLLQQSLLFETQKSKYQEIINQNLSQL